MAVNVKLKKIGSGFIMCEYTELLNRHKAANDDFSEKYFYWLPDDDSQVMQKMDELGLSLHDLVQVCDGGYVHKDNYNSFLELQQQIKREHKAYMLNHVYEVVYYQCWNYGMEENLSYNYHDFIFKLLDFSIEEFTNNADEIERALWDYQMEFYNDC